VLGVDEYVNRVYESRDGVASLYIGYYQSQRQGDTIHSPMNCLPGSGWEPLSRSYLTIPVGTDVKGSPEITVNRYVIQKGLDRQVVLYWYQSHGRAIANEYRSKIFMVYDAVRLNRTDAALVRVVSPRYGTDAAAEDRASDRAVAFVKAMFPLLDRYLPS
jgi:EpsI family protein